MDDVRKLKDEAARATEKGKHKKAAELYDRITELAARERDPQWRYRAGLAYRKAGDRARALDRLQDAAAFYARRGFLLKAIVACKAILEINPRHSETQEMLASLYARDRASGGDAAAADAAAVALPSPARASSTPREVPLAAAATAFAPAAAIELSAPEEWSGAAQDEDATLPDEPPVATPATAAAAPADVRRSAPAVPLADLYDRSSPDGVPLPPPPSDERHPPPAAHSSLDAISLEDFMPDAHASDDFPGVVVPLDDDALLRAARPALPWLPLFSSLDEDHLRRLIERCEFIEAGAGQEIVRQGDEGDALYVIVRGSVTVSAVADGERHELGQLGDGAFFGEMALLSAGRRNATVTADVPTELLAIRREVMSGLVEDSPEVLRTLLGFFRDRLVQRLVATSPLFKHLTAAEAEAVRARFQLLELEPAMVLLAAGHESPGVYVLLAGSCEVVRPDARGGEAAVALLGPGDLCGAMPFVHRRPPSVTVRARTRVWALGMALEDFAHVIAEQPAVLRYVAADAERRRARSATATPDLL